MKDLLNCIDAEVECEKAAHSLLEWLKVGNVTYLGSSITTILTHIVWIQVLSYSMDLAMVRCGHFAEKLGWRSLPTFTLIPEFQYRAV
jgi:hypothetical protein